MNGRSKVEGNGVDEDAKADVDYGGRDWRRKQLFPPPIWIEGEEETEGEETEGEEEESGSVTTSSGH